MEAAAAIGKKTDRMRSMSWKIGSIDQFGKIRLSTPVFSVVLSRPDGGVVRS